MDDNNRVRKGDLLVQLDKEPYQVQVDITQAAVERRGRPGRRAGRRSAGIVGQARSLRWKLEHAIEDVDNQVALLRSKVAALDSQKATLAKAQADFDRAHAARASRARSPQRGVRPPHARRCAVAQAAGRGGPAGRLPDSRRPSACRPSPATGDDLTDVPADLNQTFSAVARRRRRCSRPRRSSASPLSFNQTPKADARRLLQARPGGQHRSHPTRSSCRTRPPSSRPRPSCPGPARPRPGRAEPPLLRRRQRDRRRRDPPQRQPRQQRRRRAEPDGRPLAHRDLDRRQLQGDAARRPAHRPAGAICEVDMYGSRQEFEGRITGFTMGTGSDPRPAAAAERHGQLREDRPAAAGADRADRLRPRQGPPVRRPVGDALRVLQGAADGAARRDRSCNRMPPASPCADEPAAAAPETRP